MKVVISVAVVLLFLSCSSPPGSPNLAELRTESSPSSSVEAATQSRQLVRSVSMSVESSDPHALAKRAELLATSHGGYVESLEAQQWQNGTHYTLVLRVSAKQLEAAVETLRSEASEVLSESWSTEDVTSQVVDMDARTRALRLTEQQLEELLAESRNAGRDAEGIMAIFRELTSVREEREKVQGRLAAVQELVSLSRISVRIAPAESGARTSITWGVGETVRNAVQVLLLSLRAILRLSIYLLLVGLPVGLLLGTLMLGARALRSRIRRSG